MSNNNTTTATASADVSESSMGESGDRFEDASEATGGGGGGIMTSESHQVDHHLTPHAVLSATSSGDGVSPAAIAAIRGSPPGNAAATSWTDLGRRAGSL